MALTRDGGKPNVKQLRYATPQGPIGQQRNTPGISDDIEPRYGMGGEALHERGEREFTGSPGIGGTNHGNKGSQGQH